MKEKLEVTMSRLVPSHRLSRIAKGLKNTGDCRLTLLAASWDEELISPYFDDFISFGFGKKGGGKKAEKKKDVGMDLLKEKMLPVYGKKLKKALKKMPVNGILHYTAPPVSLGKVVVENANCPVVYDQYDLMLQSYTTDNLNEGIVADERYCLENASGIVHKGPKLELDFYRDKGYSLAKNEIIYPDYCDKDHFKKINGEKDGGYHIVYLGGIHGPGKPYYILPEIRTLTEQGFHFHIYARMTSMILEDLQVYYDEEKKNERFHMHYPVSYPGILDEIKKYHFGFYYFNYDTAKYPQESEKARTAAGNKIPTYYEAGLPVIISNLWEYSAKFVSDYGAGLVVEHGNGLNTLKEQIENNDLSILRKGVENARKDLSMDRHAPRLVEFYRSLL